MTGKRQCKGANAEEAMRQRFRQMGYLAVRDIPYSFREFSVTDIDLWLYGPAGAFRERINVDIKNKKTPQAIERIFWAIGVMQVLRLDRCIVVTTETNPAVVDFGKRGNVTVIDGHCLRAVTCEPWDGRLSEEDFCRAVQPADAEDKAKELQRRLEGAKKRLLTHFNFDGCNQHLLDIGNCMDDLIAYPGMASGTRRLLYLLVSYLIITIDYLLSKSVFIDTGGRREEVEAGLRFGSAGRHRLEEFGRILEGCRSPGNADTNRVIAGIVASLRNGAAALRTDIVAEYLVQQVGPDKLFRLAQAFEQAAYAPDCPMVMQLHSDLKSAIMMLVDFHGADRNKAMTW